MSRTEIAMKTLATVTIIAWLIFGIVGVLTSNRTLFIMFVSGDVIAIICLVVFVVWVM